MLVKPISNFLFGGALLTAILLTSVSHVSAAEKSREWIALSDKYEPGTEVKVSVDKERSNDSRTVINGEIPGYWVETKVDPGGREYQLFTIPGMGSQDALGVPDLPLYRFKLAVPQAIDSATVELEAAGKKRLRDVSVWPQPIPEMDGEKEGTPEQFRINKKIYASDSVFPRKPIASSLRVGTALRNIPAVSAEFSPMQWNPKTGALDIITNFSIFVSHEGKPIEYEALTKERYKLASKTFLNWEILEAFTPNLYFYTSSFLFVYPDSSYRDELLPLINQKKARGFVVTELTVDGDIGSHSCNDIRDAIIDWEANVPWYHDAYTLLVGDTEVIPHCTSPTGDQTDDLYASTNGDDLDEEIYLGRLSVDNEADLAHQVNKILTYEDSPSSFCCYDRAVLWAHKENAPGKYVGAHETVRTNSYSNPPNFVTRYGHLNGVDDNDIRGDVNNGIGLLAYRGHGSSVASATGWDLAYDYFNGTDVSLLSNTISRSPVVWSFACTNSRLDDEDSIAEKWMENIGGGAVSYYGATRTSYTSANHVLDEWMFKAVYDEGLITQSHAIQRGEDQMAALNSLGDNNAWMYLLLGDPDLQIRTENPVSIVLEIPDFVAVCKFCDLKLEVFNKYGDPLRNALVGLYKAGPKGIEEVATNAYTDRKGQVSLNYSALTTGEMLIAVEDGKGNAVLEKIQVVK